MFVSRLNVVPCLGSALACVDTFLIHPLNALFTLLNSMPSLGSAVFHTTTPAPTNSTKNSQLKPLEYTTTELRTVMAKKRRMSVVYEVEVVRVT